MAKKSIPCPKEEKAGIGAIEEEQIRNDCGG
jgi:hypothetical protein